MVTESPEVKSSNNLNFGEVFEVGWLTGDRDEEGFG
jgi:hypothetical protein